MKYCIIIIIMLFSTSVLAQSVEDESNGFRGIQWGTDINKIPGLKYAHTSKVNDTKHIKLKVYKKKGDKLRIGGANLLFIEYAFWNDKFSGIMTCVKGKKNWENLKSATYERFGQGRKNYTSQEDWSYKNAGIILKPDYSLDEGGCLQLYSLDIFRKFNSFEGDKERKIREADKKKAQQGARSDF